MGTRSPKTSHDPAQTSDGRPVRPLPQPPAPRVGMGLTPDPQNDPGEPVHAPHDASGPRAQAEPPKGDEEPKEDKEDEDEDDDEFEDDEDDEDEDDADEGQAETAGARAPRFGCVIDGR